MNHYKYNTSSLINDVEIKTSKKLLSTNAVPYSICLSGRLNSVPKGLCLPYVAWKAVL